VANDNVTGRILVARFWWHLIFNIEELDAEADFQSGR